MTGAAKNTVVKLLADIGSACAAYHDRYVRNLRVRRLQCDEIWSFVGAKKKNVSIEKKQEGWGDTWTWVGLDADSKMVVSYLVGGRDAGWGMEFMDDCASRIVGRVQITTDGHRVYWMRWRMRLERILTTRCCRRFTALRLTKKRGVTLLRGASVPI